MRAPLRTALHRVASSLLYTYMHTVYRAGPVVRTLKRLRGETDGREGTRFVLWLFSSLRSPSSPFPPVYHLRLFLFVFWLLFRAFRGAAYIRNTLRETRRDGAKYLEFNDPRWETQSMRWIFARWNSYPEGCCLCLIPASRYVPPVITFTAPQSVRESLLSRAVSLKSRTDNASLIGNSVKPGGEYYWNECKRPIRYIHTWLD